MHHAWESKAFTGGSVPAGPLRRRGGREGRQSVVHRRLRSPDAHARSPDAHAILLNPRLPAIRVASGSLGGELSARALYQTAHAHTVAPGAVVGGNVIDGFTFVVMPSNVHPPTSVGGTSPTCDISEAPATPAGRPRRSGSAASSSRSSSVRPPEPVDPLDPLAVVGSLAGRTGAWAGRGRDVGGAHETETRRRSLGSGPAW